MPRQLGVVIPLLSGLELPLTMTVASRTETSSDVEVRGNIGFAVDTALLTKLFLDP
jgi:hypothetical protein